MSSENFQLIPQSRTDKMPSAMTLLQNSGRFTIYRSGFDAHTYVIFDQTDRSYSAHRYIGKTEDIKKNLVLFGEDLKNL